MKKTVVLLIAVSLFAILAMPVSAANTATLTVKNAVFDGETFTFRVSVTDVTDPVGFALVEYTLAYDAKRFEFVSADTVLPEKWNEYSSNPDYYENLSMQSDGSYTCAHLMYMTGVGGQSGEFYTDYTFKVLKSDAEGKSFSLKNISLISDSISEMYHGGTIQFACTTADEVSKEEIPTEPEASEEISVAADESQKGSDESSADTLSVADESYESDASEHPEADGEKPQASPVLPIIVILVVAIVGSAAFIAYRKTSKK